VHLKKLRNRSTSLLLGEENRQVHEPFCPSARLYRL
jgi:hypothetical protein